MSELNEVSRLKEELEAMKVIAKGYEQMIEKYFDADNTDDNTDERPKPDYTDLLEELEFNDRMAGKGTTKEVPNEIPPMYQKLLEELRENDEMLGKQ